MVIVIFMTQANGQKTLTKCQAERQEALSLKMVGTFIPNCDPNGNYLPRQCNGSTGYCTCVDTITGASISEHVGPTGDISKLPC